MIKNKSKKIGLATLAITSLFMTTIYPVTDMNADSEDYTYEAAGKQLGSINTQLTITDSYESQHTGRGNAEVRKMSDGTPLYLYIDSASGNLVATIGEKVIDGTTFYERTMRINRTGYHSVSHQDYGFDSPSDYYTVSLQISDERTLPFDYYADPDYFLQMREEARKKREEEERKKAEANKPKPKPSKPKPSKPAPSKPAPSKPKKNNSKPTANKNNNKSNNTTSNSSNNTKKANKSTKKSSKNKNKITGDSSTSEGLSVSDLARQNKERTKELLKENTPSKESTDNDSKTETSDKSDKESASGTKTKNKSNSEEEQVVIDNPVVYSSPMTGIIATSSNPDMLSVGTSAYPITVEEDTNWKARKNADNDELEVKQASMSPWMYIGAALALMAAIYGVLVSTRTKK